MKRPAHRAGHFVCFHECFNSLLGCHVLADSEIFLMNWDEPASLDSRYFGPLPLSGIVGRAAPLWTFEEE